jgi:hypothetical protein
MKLTDRKGLEEHLARERERFTSVSYFEVVPGQEPPRVEVRASVTGFEIRAVEEKLNGEWRNVDRSATEHLRGDYEEHQLFDACYKPLNAAQEAAVKAAFRWAMRIGELLGWGKLDTEEGIEKVYQVLKGRFENALHEMKYAAQKVAAGERCPLCERDIHEKAKGCLHCMKHELEED